MNTMLLALIGFLMVGLFASELGARQARLVSGIAIALVVAYFVHPAFMT